MKYFEKAIEIIKKIESLGYEAYIIGGAVRDYLLKLPINDIDIATNMPLDQLSNAFSVLENGSDYASITIIDQYKYEVTHFRKDIEYSKHRHPKIELVNTLKEDVNRRDFTINSLAINSKFDIIDYHNGIADLNKGLIRTIGNPMKRFDEDALRILRALYFSSKLNFDIEDETLKAIINQRQLLSFLSNERIYSYFTRLISLENKKGIDYIEKYNLFEYIVDYKRWIDIIKDNYSANDLAVYFYLSYNEYPPIISSNDKKRCTAIKYMLDNHFSLYSLFMYQNEITKLFDVISNLGYDIIEIKENLKILKIKSDTELAISKKELSTMYQGKMISIVIKEIINAILEDRLTNDRNSILTFLQGLDVLEC